jgi:hypothetical protein
MLRVVAPKETLKAGIVSLAKLKYTFNELAVCHVHYFHPRLTFTVTAGACQKMTPLGRLLALPANIRLGWKGLI